MNKRGDLGDFIWFMVVIFVVALVSIVSWKLMTVLNTDFQANSQISSGGKTIFSNINGRFVSIVDSSFLMVLIGLFLAITIGAFFIKSHPLFFFLSIPILAFIVFLGMIYANFFDQFSNTTDFASSTAGFNIIPFVMNHFIFFIVVFIVIFSIALYAKNSLFDNSP